MNRKRQSPRRKTATEDAPVGDLLRHAREQAGLTQAELAHQFRCTQQAIAQAERAETNHTIEFLRRWAKACKKQLSIRID
ncbi:MAG TPA: helix-turn-helix transcriptional regulator [Thermoanaerobaculia bacterium]|nr:helix-turn-helix transcriptional regulator [Thermoanaerobaculia bacterium]